MPLFIPSHYNPVTHRVDNVALRNSSFNENIDDNPVDYSCDAIGTSLQNLRKKNPNRIIISHLNINSIRNEIEMISDIIIGNIDIMLFSETKIDESLGVIVLFMEVVCFYMSERTYLLNYYLVHTAPKLNVYLSK